MLQREWNRFLSGRLDGSPLVQVVAVILTLGVTACDGQTQPPAGPSAGTHPATTTYAAQPAAPALRATAAAALAAPTEPSTSLTCTPTGAHAKHLERGLTCANCHPCGSGIEIASFTYPGGTTTGNSTVVRANGTTTCQTGCHAPLGSTPTQVSWNSVGPLPCSACHNTIGLPAGVPVMSSHPGLGTESVLCTGCHDTSAHTSGQVRLVGGVDSTCQGCHSGNGSTLVGITPPLLVGWTDRDPHGDPAGQGYGGTLLAPYFRNHAALTCTDCHDAHASGNPFLFAKTVNGRALAPGQITRAGVGAQALCESCHAGERHAKCAQCHLVDPKPAGAGCLACHTHEGTLWFPWPGGSPANYHDQSQNASCDHCHSPWDTTPTTTPPVILYPGNEIISVTPGNTDATITWQTDVSATSFVEYGTADLGFVAGSPVLAQAHTVQLTGLTTNTTYLYRIRTVDRSRNVTRSATRTFTTLCPTCIPDPAVVANGNFDVAVTAVSEQTGAWWMNGNNGQDYIGTFASTEMTGGNVFRIAVSPRQYLDWDTGDFYTEDGWGSLSYKFTRAELDGGGLINFDVRPKALPTGSTVSLVLYAYDATGAVLSDTANAKNVFDLIGTSSALANGSLRIASPTVNTTYTRTIALKAAVAGGLANGWGWNDVAKVWMVLQVTSGSGAANVYLDNFR